MEPEELIGAKVIKIEGDLTGLVLEKDGKKYKIYPLDAYDGWGMGYYRDG